MPWARLSTLLAALAAGPALASCPAAPLAGGAEVYPTARVLPENTLRMYVYFPRRMAEAGIFDEIALLDSNGAEVEGAFLPGLYDLWSADRRRLTLLFDPGRVKTGLNAHEAQGRALEPGQDYRLVIRGAARDATGCPLGADLVHSFSVGPADLSPPSPKDWALTLPQRGTTAPLVVALGDPHDHLSLAYRLRVRDGAGTPVPGRISLGPAETSWIFHPSTAWSDSAYSLTIDARLEDLAGNRPPGLFDRPAGTPDLAWARSLPLALTR